MIVAPDFEINAIKILKKKRNLILFKMPKIKKIKINCKSTVFGNLYQTNDLISINQKFINLVTNNKTSLKSIQDLIFSLKVVKHLKSNAVVLTKNKQTLGLGHGQTNRVDALNFAIKNKKKYFKEKNLSVLQMVFFPLQIV